MSHRRAVLTNLHLLETLDVVSSLDGVGLVQSNTYLGIMNEDYLIG